jgi:hypothetical protein
MNVLEMISSRTVVMIGRDDAVNTAAPAALQIHRAAIKIYRE